MILDFLKKLIENKKPAQEEKDILITVGIAMVFGISVCAWFYYLVTGEF